MADKLDPITALEVAMRCVKDVSGNDGEEDEKIGDVGIDTKEDIRSLKEAIAEREIGVKREGFQMTINDLAGMSASWTVGGVGRRIQKKAVPAKDKKK
ncbi:MAG TPA: hypothetical protein VGP08_26045 [Pyrinomonadaceae bacterium]|jgi:hypothetical protein|nr:hypothetical protein [Pyrinomonadaceae bacterium]